jgi:iron complex outermembrane receptor protein
MLKKGILHIVLWLLLCVPSQGQVADLSQDYSLESTLGELIIVGEWSTLYLYEIKDSIDQKRFGAESLGQVLERRGMANTLMYGPQGSAITARVNGSAPDHTSIFLNGVSINSPSLGLADLSLVPVGAFGSTSFLQNSRAQEGNQGGMSASIDLQPRRGRSSDLRLSSGFNNLQNSFTKAQGLWYRNSFQFSLFAQHEINDNEFSYTDVYQLRSPRVDQHHNNSKQSALLGNAEYRINNAMVARAFVWWQKRASNLPSIMGSASAGSSSQTDSLWRAGTELVWRDLYHTDSKWSNGEVKWRSTWIQDHQVYRDLMHVYDPPQWLVSAMHSRIFVNEVAGSVDRLLWSFNGNARYQAQKVVNSNYQDGQRVEPFQSFFGSIRRNWNYTDKSHVYGYYYQEWRAHYYAAPSYGLRVVYEEKNRLKWKPRVEIEASNKFRIPDFNERYWVPGGNASLKPERGATAHVNLFWKLQDFRSRVFTVMLESRYADFTNWIQWVPTSMGYWQPVNFKHVTTWSSTMALDFKKAINTNFISAQLRYQYTDSRHENELYMPYTPAHTFSTSADFSRKHWDVGVAFRWYSERYTNESNTASLVLPAYGLTDVFAGYAFGKSKWLELRCTVQNVFNVDYQSIRSYAMPGRVVGVELQWNILNTKMI